MRLPTSWISLLVATVAATAVSCRSEPGTRDAASGSLSVSTSSSPSSGDAAVQIYPAAPTAASSTTYRVTALGQTAFVEHYANVSYVRFAFRGPVDVAIAIDAPVTKQRFFPVARAGAAPVAAGNGVTLHLTTPESFTVWLNDLEPLFVLVDPWEDDPPQPGAPGVVSALDFAADATGSSLATAALQAAIDQVSAAGGGTVVLSRGVFRSGTLSIKSNVTLYLAAGALLLGSDDPRDYPVDPGRHETGSDASLPADVRFYGRTMTFSRLLLVDQAANVRIAGRGTIDGSGTVLRTQHDAVPNMLRIRQSTNVVVEDVFFRNSAAWTIHPLASSHVTLDNVKIVNDRSNLNTDGIDPDMSTDVVIDHAFIYTKDDGVCVKATQNGDLTGDPARIRVTNSVVSSLDAALKLGTESSAAALSDVVFENDHVFDTGRAMSIVVRDGAVFDGVTYRGITVAPHVDHLVEQVIGVRDPTVLLGVVRNLAFEDITAPSFTRPTDNWTWYAQFRPGHPQDGSNANVFEGADAAHGVDGLSFKNVVIDGQHIVDQASAGNVAHLTFGPNLARVTFE